MKLFNQARKYGAKIVNKTAATGLGLLLIGGAAMAQEAGSGDNAWEQIFASIGIAGIAAAVVTLMIGVVGIAMAFQGGKLGKRAVRMV